VANHDASMITIHADLQGLDFLIGTLHRIRQLVSEGECEDRRLYCDDAFGAELSSTLLQSEAETKIVEHVRIYGWTHEWVIKHKLLPRHV